MKIIKKGLALIRPSLFELGIFPDHPILTFNDGHKEEVIGLDNSIWFGSLNKKDFKKMKKFNNKKVKVVIEVTT